MKRIIALMTVTAFALSMAPNISLAQTNAPTKKQETTCGCGKDCSGPKCKCGCQTAKKDQKTDKSEKKEGA